MRDARLRRLFLRFRDRQDGRALAAIFDATAPELADVARHLVTSREEAEDVLQTTFLRLIEGAGRYDGDRPLRAWMYGILVREAARARRRGARRVDPIQLGRREPATPVDEARSRELLGTLPAALAAVPAPYREVLEPVLLEERSPREVATALARAPGTVRVQLQRGLARLRSVLASGPRERTARPTSAALAFTADQWSALRRRVLENAGATPAALSAGAAGATAGVWLLATVALGLVTVLSAPFLASRPDEEHTPVRTEPRSAVHGPELLLPEREPAARHEASGVAALPAPDSMPAATEPRATLLVRRPPGEAFDRPIAAWVRGPGGTRRQIVEPAGVARFEDLVPGEHEVWTQNESGPNYLPRAVVLSAEATREMTLRPGDFLLEGRVTLGDRPLSRAWIRARALGADGLGQRASATVLADGTWRMDGLLPGPYRWTAGHPGCLSLSGMVAVSEDAAALEIAFPEGRIEGRLHDVPLDQRPGVVGLVQLFPCGWGEETRGRGVTVQPDADGRFVFEGIPPGRHVVSLSPESVVRDRVPPQVVRIDADTPVARVELGPVRAPGSLRGTLVPAPAGPTRVTVFRLDQGALVTAGHAAVDGAGEFRLENLEPGRHAVLVCDPRAAVPSVFQGDVAVVSGRESTVVVPIVAGALVRVRFSPDDAEVPQATWSLRLPTGETLPYYLFVGTDADGLHSGSQAFRWPLGPIRIEADLGDGVQVVASAEVVPGPEPLEITVHR